MKPVPASVRQHLDSGPRRRDDDDEAFLDEEAEEDLAVRDGFPLHLPPRHHHIVYRRSPQDSADGEMSDYGQFLLSKQSASLCFFLTVLVFISSR